MKMDCLLYSTFIPKKKRSKLTQSLVNSVLNRGVYESFCCVVALVVVEMRYALGVARNVRFAQGGPKIFAVSEHIFSHWHL